MVSLRVPLGIDATDRRKRSHERIRKYCFESGDTVIEILSKLQSGQLLIPFTNDLVERYQIVNQRLQDLSTLTLSDLSDQLFPDGVDEVAELRKLVLAALEQAEDIHELFNIVNTEMI